MNSWGYITSLRHSAEVAERLKQRAWNSYRPYTWRGVVAGKSESMYDSLMASVFGQAWEQCWQTGDVVLIESFGVLQMAYAAEVISLWEVLASKQLIIYSLADMREVQSVTIRDAVQCLKPFTRVAFVKNHSSPHADPGIQLTTEDAPLGFMRSKSGSIVPNRKQRKLMSQIKIWNDLGYGVASIAVKLSTSKIRNHLGNIFTEGEVNQLLKAEKRIQQMEDKLASGEVKLWDVHKRWRKLDQLASYRGKPFPRDKTQEKFHKLLRKQQQQGRTGHERHE